MRTAVVVTLVLACLGLWCWWRDTAPLPPGAVTSGVAASAPDPAAVASPPDPVADRDAGAMLASPPLVAAPPAAAADLRIVVRNERGDPLPDCRVMAGGDERVSDRNGGAEFVTAGGRVFVVVEPPLASGLEPRRGWQHVTAGARVEVEVVLAALAMTTFWCQLVAAEDGRALAGIDGVTGPDGRAWRTDSEGFVQASLPSGEAWLEVEAPGRSVRRIVAPGGHATRPTALRVPLAQACTLQLRTVDAAGAAVAGVAVGLTAPPWTLQWPPDQPSRGGERTWRATTDAAGTATIAGLPCDLALAVTWQPPATHAAPEPAHWSFAAPTEQRTVLVPVGGGVCGRLLDADGRPVAHAAVHATPASGERPPRVLPGHGPHRAQTTDDGAFVFAGLTPGRWWVGSCHDRGRAAAIGAALVEPGRTTAVELRAPVGRRIAGCAVDDRGAPCVDVPIDLEVDGQFLIASTTDDQGRFAFAAVPDGPCVLSTDAYGTALGLAAPVTVAAGDERVRLHLRPVHGGIVGRLDAGPAWVMLHHRDRPLARGAQCDLDGTFTHLGLAAGTWDLVAQDRQGRVAWCADVVVQPGRTTGPVELVLAPGARLRPRHAAADEFVVRRGEQVVCRDNLVAGASGEAQVPPGAWTVVFHAAGREIARREVTVRAGDDRPVAGDG